MNIATNTLKKLVAQWVRAWLPFTVVTKGGWLGFSVIQDAVDFCGARGGGTVFIGPGTYYEGVTISDDYVNIVGSGMGVTKIYGVGSHGVKLDGDYCSASFMTIDTESGSGAIYTGHACFANADYGMFFRILCTESDAQAFQTDDLGMAQLISHCIVPISNHDGYAVDTQSPQCIFTSNKFHSGGGYNFMIEDTGDETLVNGNIIDGESGGNYTTYGVIIGTNAENCIVTGNWVGNFTNQVNDVWDRSGTSLTTVPDGGGPLNETV